MAFDSSHNITSSVPLKTWVLHVITKHHFEKIMAQEKLEEAVNLAQAIQLSILGKEIITVDAIRPATLFGKGKVEELKEKITNEVIELVVINHTLSPIQQRNLEKAWKCKVIDRTALVLEIFGARARTKEGQLQVDLAALEYQKSRLVRSWTHLERQRGGVGFLGGPGETQIEADRRMISEQIVRLKEKLEGVRKTRELHRASRRKVPYPIIALVGYTNAGKSTLFNYLTGASVFAENLLFATLDPTMRLIELPSRKKVILSDTVGFISDLPTELVAAFRATLEEVSEADILLHVRDISHPSTEQQKKDVEKVLESMGLERQIHHSMIEIWNKIDLLSEKAQEDLLHTLPPSAYRVAISALKQTGKEVLLEAIDTLLSRLDLIIKVFIPYSSGKIYSWVHAHTKVLEMVEKDHEICIRVQITPEQKPTLEQLVQEQEEARIEIVS